MRSWLRRSAPVVITILLLIAIPLVFVACSVATWLPDSSGFVYINGKGEVTLYDLKSKKQTPVAKTKILGAAASLSPDGKKVVVAKLEPQKNGKSGSLQIEIYDIKGKRLHAAKPFQVVVDERSPMLSGSHVEMSSDNRHIVVFVTSSMSAVIYDMKEEKFQSLPKVISIPSYFLPWPMPVRHIAPNGEGFIAVASLLNDTPVLIYRPWNAAGTKKIAVPEEIVNLAETSGFAKMKGGVLTQPAWKKQRLVALFEDGELAIDCKQGKIIFKKSAAAAKLLEHAKKHEVNVVAQLAKGALLQVKSGIEVQLYRPGKEVVVLAKGEKQMQTPITIIPSPDRKLLIVQKAFGKNLMMSVLDIDGKKIFP